MEVMVKDNHFSGELDLSELPSSVQQIRLSNNNFSGPLDLTRLPPQLMAISCDYNNFDGRVDLTKLPTATLMIVSLHQNNFSGPVNLTTLPSTLTRFDLQGNPKICGTSPISNASPLWGMDLPVDCKTTTNPAGSKYHSSMACPPCP